MEIKLGRKLEVLAEKNNAFRESYNTFIRDTNGLKDYIRKAFDDESISFSENGNDFVVHTEFYTLPNNALMCEFSLNQMCFKIADDGSLYYDDERLVCEYDFEVHYKEDKEKEAFGYAWQVVEAFVNALNW